MRCRSRVIRVKSGCALDAMLVDDDRASEAGTKQGVATQTTHNKQ
ncbi:hypothetical protein [Natronomonas sp.]